VSWGSATRPPGCCRRSCGWRWSGRAAIRTSSPATSKWMRATWAARRRAANAGVTPRAIIAIAVERKGFGKKSKRWKLGRTRIQVMPDTKAQPADGAGRLAAVAGDPRRAAQGTATHEVTRVARTRPDVAARCVGRALGPSALQPKSTCQVSCQEQPGATRHSGYSLKPRFSLATPIGAGCRARDPAPPPAGQSARRRSSGGGHLPLCLCRLLWPARRSSLRTPFVMRQGPVR
jgi:hypothetical protein